MNFLLLFCLLFIAPDTNAKAPEPDSNPKIETINLQLKWFHQFQFAGYYAAKEKGYYSDVGLKVNLIERTPKINVVDQVSSGAAHYGIEDTGIIVRYANGEPIKALAAIFQHNPYIFISKQSSGIVSPYEMIGKRVMYDKKDGKGAEEIPLRALLAETGITDEQFTHIKTSFDKNDLIQDKTDVISGYITDAPRFFEARGVKINVINPLNYGIDFYGDLLFTSDKEVQNNPKRVQSFLQASIKGWRYALEHQEEIIQLILQKYHSKLTIEELRYEAKQIYKLILPDSIPIGEIKPSRLRVAANLYTRLNLSPALTEHSLNDFININSAKLKISDEERNWLQKHPEITFTGDPDWLPYEAFDEKGNYIGIVSEYLAKIEILLGIKFTIIPTNSWVESVDKAEGGEVDIISETVNSTLQTRMNFTKPYLSSPIVIIMHKDAPYVDSINQIAAKKIALIKDYGYVHEIIKKYPKLNILWVNSIDEGLTAVSTGQVDALLSTLAHSIYKISKNNLTNLRIVGKTEFSNDLAYGIQKKLAPLVPLFNRAINAISEAEKRRISAAWGEEKYREKIDFQLVIKGVSALLILIAVFILWNRKLAKEIIERKNIENSLRQSEQRFRTIFNDTPLGVARINSLSGQIYEVNPCYEKIICRTQKELQSLDWMSITHPDDLQEDLDNMALMNSGKSTGFNMEKRLIRPDGSLVWINMTIAPMQVDNSNEPLHLCMMEDITQRKIKDDQLKLAETVYQNTNQAIMVTDTNNLLVAVNPAFTELTGYSLDDVQGKNPRFLKSNRQDSAFFTLMWESLNSTGYWQGEIWNLKKNGDEYAELLTINSIYDENNNILQRVGLFSDITEKKRADEKIWKQANFDSLTQLPNRQMFSDRLAHDIKLSQRSNKPLALFILDLDHFKEVNDALGHDNGDLLLIEAASRLKKCVRNSDTVSRLGGDEFTIILPELDDTQAVDRIVENIILSLQEPFALGMEEAYISASIGIALYPSDSDEIGKLIKFADQAMYLAKENGRNQFRFFTQSMQFSAQLRHQLMTDLRSALKEHQFQLYYQAITELQTGKIIKAEALLRWLHPSKGMINPADFIPLAEESGLIVDIGNWVFEQAVCDLKRWQQDYAVDLQVSINKSAVQFRSETDYQRWIDHIHQTGVDGSSIVVEITESLLVESSDHVKTQLLDFRDQGIQVAIDDFGTGYSSLSYLNKFDIDYLKIDRSFISNLASGSNELILCEAIIVMAHKLGLKVIAEGIETQEQQQFLVDAGCDFGQGFLFSRPLPVEDFEKVLAEINRASIVI